MPFCTNVKCKYHTLETKTIRHGLCNNCSQRMRRNGTLEYQNPDSLIGRAPRPGDKHLEHPLYVTWQSFKTRHKDDIPPEWNVLENYAKDVGAKPSPRHFMAK